MWPCGRGREAGAAGHMAPKSLLPHLGRSLAKSLLETSNETRGTNLFKGSEGSGDVRCLSLRLTQELIYHQPLFSSLVNVEA